MNVPTYFTLFRIFAIPVVIFFYLLPFQWTHPVAAIIFIIAAITDWLDGYLARSLSQTTSLGAFLDPVADKLLIAMVMVVIVGQHVVILLSIPAAIIIGREIAISALREWMAEIGKRVSVAVNYLGKIKTTVQMVAVILLLWYHPSGATWIKWWGVAGLWIAAVLTLWSMIIYLKLAWPDLTLSKEQ